MRLFRQEPGQSLAAAALYRACRAAVDILATLVYRFRVYRTNDLPERGGLLVIANHVSHLDPPLIAAALRERNMRAIARSGLFKHKLFARLIDALGAIPIRENEGDMQAMRRAIAEIQAGRVVLIFPEGTRSLDGQLKEFKRGCWLLLQRAKCDVLPVAIVGSYEAWPRGTGLPTLNCPPGGCAVMIGEVLKFAEIEAHTAGDADRGLAFLRARVADLQRQLHERVTSSSSPRTWGV